MTTVWVFAELGPDGPQDSALELLTKARSLGDEVGAVAFGPGAAGAAGGARRPRRRRRCTPARTPRSHDHPALPAAHALAALARAARDPT